MAKIELRFNSLTQSIKTLKESLDVIQKPEHKDIYHFLRDSVIQRFEYSMKNKNLFPYFLPPLLFFIDILLLGVFQQQTVSLLFCFYAIWLTKPNQKNLLFLNLFFLSAVSLILYGTFGFSLIYLLPLTILTLWIKKLFNKTFWIPYAFLASSMLVADLLVKPWLLTTNPNTLFTGAKLCVNLIIILIIEKIFFPKVI